MFSVFSKEFEAFSSEMLWEFQTLWCFADGSINSDVVMLRKVLENVKNMETFQGVESVANFL